MALFPPDCGLRGFPAATYGQYDSPQNLVRPCPTKINFIYGTLTRVIKLPVDWLREELNPRIEWHD